MSPDTGLGLSMVRSIVEFYNDKIDCRSTPNASTTFDILFPTPPQSTVTP